MAHTPGPWNIEDDRPSIICGTNRVICEVAKYKAVQQRPERHPAFVLDEQGEANAHLIAAAPTMLEALWAADEAFSTLSSEWCARERELVRVAIAKAEGR